MVEMDGDWNGGAGRGERRKVNEEAGGEGDCPGEELDDERGALGFGSADEPEDVLDVVSRIPIRLSFGSKEKRSYKAKRRTRWRLRRRTGHAQQRRGFDRSYFSSSNPFCVRISI